MSKRQKRGSPRQKQPSPPGEPDHLESLVSDLRSDIDEVDTAPVLDEPKEGREISPRRLSRRMLIGIAMVVIVLLLGAIFVVRLQQGGETAVTTNTPSQFEVEGEWLTPGPQEPLALPEQDPVAPPPLPTMIPTPPIDMSSPLP